MTLADEVKAAPGSHTSERLTVYGEVIGTRVWPLVRSDDGDFHLTGKTMNDVDWERVTHARCRNGRELANGRVENSSHDALLLQDKDLDMRSPVKGCGCGIWIVWPDKENEFADSNSIHGTVACWGKVLPGELGARVEYAMINSFTMPKCAKCDKAATQLMWEVEYVSNPPAKQYGADYEYWRSTPAGVDHIKWSGGRATGFSCDECAKPSFISRGQSRGHKCHEYRCRFAVRIVRGGNSWCKFHAPVAIPMTTVLGSLSAHYDVPLTTAAQDLPVKELDEEAGAA